MFRWRSKVNIPILSFLFMFYHVKWSQHMSGQIAGSGRHPTWWLEITRWWYRDVFRGVPRTIVRTLQAYMVNVVGTLTVLQEILSRYVKVIFPSYVCCLINPMNTILTAVTIVRSIIHHRYGIYVHQFIYHKSAIIRWNPNCLLAKSQFKVLPTTETHNSPKVPCITGRLRRPREYYRLLGTHTHTYYIYTHTQSYIVISYRYIYIYIIIHIYILSYIYIYTIMVHPLYSIKYIYVCAVREGCRADPPGVFQLVP